MEIEKTDFEGVFIIKKDPFEDERGAFFRLYCQKEFSKISNFNIRQINYSKTKKKGTTRGLHFQYEPDAEIKIVTCLKGSVFDFIVDIRKNSKTFLKTFSTVLTSENNKSLYIPKGFAHGFQALSDGAELIYFHSEFYTPLNEGALNLKDPLLDIDLPLESINLSKRDESHKFLDKNFQGIDINEM